jgi:acyl dehydratase
MRRMETSTNKLRLGIDDLLARAGEELAVSDWVEVDQARIDRFSEATGDWQWIHTDLERAASSPFGGTIAHGLLTLAIAAGLRSSIIEITDSEMSVNYGLDRVRFTAVVPTGSRIRARIGVDPASKWITPEDFQVHWRVTVERESDGKTVCVAMPISRLRRRAPA